MPFAPLTHFECFCPLPTTLDSLLCGVESSRELSEHCEPGGFTGHATERSGQGQGRGEAELLTNTQQKCRRRDLPELSLSEHDFDLEEFSSKHDQANVLGESKGLQPYLLHSACE